MLWEEFKEFKQKEPEARIQESGGAEFSDVREKAPIR
jgi:hypothetical protein